SRTLRALEMTGAHLMSSTHMNVSRGLVAVVEDDASLNSALGRLLQAAGFGVRLYEAGTALLEDPDASAMQCFVLDVHLPDMSAFELYRRVAAAGAARPTVFITAHDDPHNRRLAMRLGADYLAKPFENSLFLRTVARMIDTSIK